MSGTRDNSSPEATPVVIIGRGKLGLALAAALSQFGGGAFRVVGPFGRETMDNATRAIRDAVRETTFNTVHDDKNAQTWVAQPVVLLAVPEQAIAPVASALPEGALVGHCSASFPLAALAPHARFNLHPLLPLSHATTAASARGAAPTNPFRGAAAAISASSPFAATTARALATALELRAIDVADAQRPLYHAAASIAANFLVTLEAVAEELAQRCGLSRADLTPLARAALEGWSVGGFGGGISGPVSRGDVRVVEAQRDAIAAHDTELLPLFDTLVAATQRALRRPLGAGEVA